MTITRHPTTGLQRSEARCNGWTKARREVFLDELASSANFRRAAAAAGMSADGARRLRRRDAPFAALCEKAHAEGVRRLEEEVLAHQLAQLPSDDNPSDERQPHDPIDFDVRTALDFLKWKAGISRGQARDLMPTMTREAVDAALMDRLEAYSKRMPRA